MIYDYFCQKCELEFTLIKSVKDYKSQENCQSCGNPSDRIFSAKVYFTGTKVQDSEFNIGLGKITKSKQHREELAKRAGLVEIGNDFKKPDSIHKQFDSERADKLKKRYDEI